MTKLLDIGIDRIGKILKEMLDFSEITFLSTIEAYEKNRAIKSIVFQNSEKLRMLQDEISEFAIELIARYQPVATDLRFIKSSLEISYDISRFGRYSFEITDLIESSLPLADCDKSIVLEMARYVRNMIAISAKCLSLDDTDSIRKLYELEDIVDEQYKKYLKQTIQFVNDNNKHNNTLMNLNCHIITLLILTYIERIGDHACSIGDSVEYIITGTRSIRR